MRWSHRAVGCSQNVRLRSANRGNSYNTWNVNTSGNVNNNNASNANRFSPDCVIEWKHTAASEKWCLSYDDTRSRMPCRFKAKQYEGDDSAY